MSSRYCQDMLDVLDQALNWAKELKKSKIESSHLLMALYSSEEQAVQELMNQYLPPLEKWLEYYLVDQGMGRFEGAYRDDAYLYDVESRRILYQADQLYRHLDVEWIYSEFVLDAVLGVDSTAQSILIDRDIDPIQLQQILRENRTL